MNKRWVVSIAATSMLMLNGIPTAALAQAASDEIPSDASAGLASGVEKAPEKDSGIAEREDRSELGDVSKSWGSLNYKYESDTGTLILSGIYNGDSNSDPSAAPWKHSQNGQPSISSVVEHIKFDDLKPGNSGGYVTSVSKWFADCPNLLDVDCEGWNSAHVNDMSGLFKNCPKLTKVDNLTQLNMTGTANCSSMFEGCSQLESVTIFDPDWSDNPVKPTNVSRMFKDCAKLWEVDLGNMSIGADAEAPNMEEMFSGCNNLTAISFNSDSLYFTDDIFDADDDFLKIDGVWVYQSAQDASITLHHSLPRAEDDGEVSGRYNLIKRTPLKTLGLSFAPPRAGEKLPKEGNIMVEALFYMQGSDNADKAQKFYVPTGLTWKPTPADPDETADYETEYTASVPWTSVIGEFVVDENTPIEYENPEGTQGSGPIRIWRDGGTLSATFKTNSKPTASSGIKFDPSDLRKVYTGDPVTLKPTITRGHGGSLEGDEERMSYEHRAAGAEPSEEWTAGLPTNAGSYEVRATLAPAEDDEHEYSGAQVVVELVVDKADYQVGDPAIDYQDELIVLTGEDAGSVEATADGVSLEVAAGTGSATVSLTEALDAPAWSAPGEEHAVALSIRGDDNHNGYAKEIRVPSRPSVELRVASQPSEPGQQGVIAGFDPAAAAAGLYEMAATSGQAPARGAASWGPAPLAQDAEGAWVAQLDPGTYAFRLKASDESGSFASLESAPLTVTAPSGITPPATDGQPQQPQPLPQQPNDTQALPSAGDTATAAAMSALASGAVVALSVAAATRRSKR